MDGVFHLEPVGNLGNLMIEYMAALKFASLVPGCRISNIRLPTWGIDHPPIASPGPTAYQRDQQYLDLSLATSMRDGRVARIEWTGYGQRMEYFLPREHYDAIFVPPFSSNVGFGQDYLVCPVRAGDVLHGPSPAYPLTPVEFYADIVAQTGLTPVFIGQTELNDYTARLRERFPAAPFLHSGDPMLDFEMIRQSKNIVVGVSTFVWLAAWLSHADTIHMAVSGLYNPMQKRDVDLLPFGDARYHFWLFPINHATPLAEHAVAHRRIAPYWRLVPHDTLQRQFAEAPRFERTLAMMEAAFDEHYYLAANGDVAEVVRTGGLTSGLQHYRNHGYIERRYPFPLDEIWYAARYPLAAFEVAQGDYADFAHHYLMIGKSRGYRPTPG
jgi:hypothetical protein